jgi:death on curing protein
MPHWLDKKALLLLHEESIATFGGRRGVRDAGALDSALARPLNLLLYKQHSDIYDLAAAYAYGLARNHAFVDGNKRAAFLAIGIFLYINGMSLKVAQPEAIQMILSLAAGEVDEVALAAWIRAHVRAGG